MHLPMLDLKTYGYNWNVSSEKIIQQRKISIHNTKHSVPLPMHTYNSPHFSAPNYSTLVNIFYSVFFSSMMFLFYFSYFFV